MNNFLEQIRKKPDTTKKWYAFAGALTFSGIIFLMWLTVIMPDFTAEQRQKNAALAKEPSPLDTLKETFSMGANAIGSQVDELKDTTETFNEDFNKYVQTASTSDSEMLDGASAETEILE